ncbi:ArgP/LysG family DNA-binding transcriptional regulator [Brevibacterium sp. 5221]|uniref:ArgP/LysG family DNA-binding transcriptional regulator n=1 Tax=Brevibacterium rongguiense TaxID=2695267 RepID=A0A6N9H783_9MICO|nr:MULTISPECIES: ArgP/LysG family DNA-binding transcriptional regulator [Brevibacterium]MYM19402.1 ArgP/LysG family DNA-binding transcriptional regulator [Brevibacterium rongguiense]WAL39301.1 ArgP/LysG family DNA-binding transcriptional regulator [Brevibacterium sp. BRM-1]
MNVEQLRAFAAAVDAGALDAAARRLHITPSAVSQRIRALEAHVGAVLLRRTSPVAPTEAGQIVLRTARQVLLVQADALACLAEAGLGGPLATGSGSGGDGDGEADGAAGGAVVPVALRLAVNADSLATWLRPLFARAAQWPDALLSLEVVDQGSSAALLTNGTVMAALSSQPRPPAGCAAVALGRMRYRAVASEALLAERGIAVPAGDAASSDGAVQEGSGPGGGLRRASVSAAQLAALPWVDYGADDDLQTDLLAARGVTEAPAHHQVPTSEAFALAVRAGLGWGMVPEAQLADAAAGGALPQPPAPLIALAGRGTTADVPLYLHRWKLASERLDRVCAAIADLARAGLRRN